MPKMWIAIREKDGLVCCLPTDYERAMWIAQYLQNVTGDRHRPVPTSS